MARKAVRTSEPAEEPLTTAEAKVHLGIASAVTGHDSWLEDTIVAIRHQWEHDTDTCLVDSTWQQTYECWPDEIELLRRPVSAIEHIKYYDTNGTLQTLASSNYRLDNGTVQPRVVWDDMAVLPALDTRPEAVIVTYSAGYADAASIPADVKHALKIALALQFEQRSGQTPGNMRANESGYNAFAMKHVRSTYP